MAEADITFTDRHRELLQELIAQSGPRASPAKRIMARRASALATWCEAAEAAMAIGKEIDMGAYTRAITALRQLLSENDGLDDYTPIVEVNETTNQRDLARRIAFVVARARHTGTLHHIDPGLLDLVLDCTPEDIEAEEVSPVASNDNPQEIPTWEH